jgi:hypothetical protein
MKKLLFIVIGLLAYVGASAQNEPVKKTSEGLKEDWDFRAYVLYPIQFGDHSLAQAHEASGGFGLNLGAVSYNNFSFYAGLDAAYYQVSDQTIIGNIENTNYTSIYGAFKYKLPVAKNIELYPAAGFGYAILKQRGYGRKFGHQDGTEFRIGFTANYRISKQVSLFLGTHYIYNRFEIATNSAYQDFFGKANQLQISLGIQLD